jgi:hypothetical protein
VTVIQQAEWYPELVLDVLEEKKCLALVYTVLFVSQDQHITQCLTENGIVIFPT